MIAISFCFGLILGALVMNLYVEQEKDRTYEAEKRALIHFEQWNRVSNSYNQAMRDNEKLLQNSADYRAKIKDLENNIELLYNNLSAKKRELIRPSNND